MEKTGCIDSRPVEKKLKERLQNPQVPASQLYDFENHYKIKLRASSYRLVYEVIEKEIVVLVIAVGKRDKNLIHKKATKRKKADRVAGSVQHESWRCYAPQKLLFS